MRFLKSVLAGCAAAFLAAVLTVPVIVWTGMREARNLPPGTSVGWDPVSLVHQWQVPAILLVSFAIGFAWEYRRLQRELGGTR